MRLIIAAGLLGSLSALPAAAQFIQYQPIQLDQSSRQRTHELRMDLMERVAIEERNRRLATEESRCAQAVAGIDGMLTYYTSFRMLPTTVDDGTYAAKVYSRALCQLHDLQVVVKKNIIVAVVGRSDLVVTSSQFAGGKNMMRVISSGSDTYFDVVLLELVEKLNSGR